MFVNNDFDLNKNNLIFRIDWGIITTLFRVGGWLSLVEHYVRDVGVVGSNPATPTNWKKQLFGCFFLCLNKGIETAKGISDDLFTQTRTNRLEFGT